MDKNLLFDVSEQTIAVIRGIWNMKLRMFLVGEEIGEVSLERLISASQPTMGVLPSFCFRLDGFFFQEGMMFFVP